MRIQSRCAVEPSGNARDQGRAVGRQGPGTALCLPRPARPELDRRCSGERGRREERAQRLWLHGARSKRQGLRRADGEASAPGVGGGEIVRLRQAEGSRGHGPAGASRGRVAGDRAIGHSQWTNLRHQSRRCDRSCVEHRDRSRNTEAPVAGRGRRWHLGKRRHGARRGSLAPIRCRHWRSARSLSTRETPKKVYAGSGEGNFYYNLGAGVYQSTRRRHDVDGGWPSAPFVGIGFYDLVVDPKNSSVLYAATTNGFYKSTNRGGSWSLEARRDVAGTSASIQTEGRRNCWRVLGRPFHRRPTPAIRSRPSRCHRRRRPPGRDSRSTA